MSVASLLANLDSLRETGHGKFVAQCPAHDDRSPSLAIKECSDGRVLVHCFAGCETEDVLSAVGLTFSDLMQERIGNDHRYKPQSFDARQVLAALDHEAMVTAIIANDILTHREVDDETWCRLGIALQRINSARAKYAPARVAR